MKTNKFYSKRKVMKLLNELHDIMEAKASLDMFNEVGFGSSGLTKEQEIELENFDLKKFIKQKLQ